MSASNKEVRDLVKNLEGLSLPANQEPTRRVTRSQTKKKAAENSLQVDGLAGAGAGAEQSGGVKDRPPHRRQKRATAKNKLEAEDKDKQTEPQVQLNASAPAFTPGYFNNTLPDAGTPSANTLLQKNGRKKQEPKPPAPKTSSRKCSSKSAPRLFLMQRPSPTPEYLARAAQPPQTLDVSRPLLVILDLNGTLLYRPRLGTNYIERPHLHQFLDYLFSNHRVMIWSSARPHNVNKMCDTLFTPEQRKQIVAIWTRDMLGLNNYMYNQKVQVYKQLSWVFNNPIIQATNPIQGGYWSQANTVLLDDTYEKAASEPHNIVQIEEFEARQDQMEADVLNQVPLYLDILRSQHDASSYMRSQPFVYDPSPSPLAKRAQVQVSYSEDVEDEGGDEGGVLLALA